MHNMCYPVVLCVFVRVYGDEDVVGESVGGRTWQTREEGRADRVTYEDVARDQPHGGLGECSPRGDKDVGIA